MADVNFFGGAPDPGTDPMGFARAQNMARSMLANGMQSPQGRMVNGQYVAPSPVSYAAQLANAWGGAQQMRNLQEASRASTILNGGTPQPRPGLFGWLGGSGG